MKIIQLNEINCTNIRIIKLNNIKCTYIKSIELNEIKLLCSMKQNVNTMYVH